MCSGDDATPGTKGELEEPPADTLRQSTKLPREFGGPDRSMALVDTHEGWVAPWNGKKETLACVFSVEDAYPEDDLREGGMFWDVLPAATRFDGLSRPWLFPPPLLLAALDVVVVVVWDRRVRLVPPPRMDWSLVEVSS